MRRSSTPLSPFPTVEERVDFSTKLWARDLRALFEHARDRFADVSWETDRGERIWAHKAIIYARAPKAFKDRYFFSKPNSRSPTSLGAPATTSNPPPSLLLPNTSPSSSSRRSSSPLPSGRISAASIVSDGTLRAPSGAYSTPGAHSGFGPDGVLRLTHEDNPEMFQAQLEWLYTSEGFGDVVEWICSEDGSLLGSSVRDSLGRRGNEADRLDKLGQDLTYMWRSKLYCDVRIHLATSESTESDSNDSDDSTDSLSSTVIFPAHRFLLVSRSPYFASVLLNLSAFRPVTADVHLPTPPFSPASLHFCLGWIYAGHLDFSNRSFDLSTAFQIHRAAVYLQLDMLVAEVESRLVYDFCHGLDSAKDLHCRRCPRRAARIWRFANESDVGAVNLENIARRYIVSTWAESWGKDIALAEEPDRMELVRDVIDSLTSNTVVAAFRGVSVIRAKMEHAVRSKGSEASMWIDRLSEMVESIEERARTILASDYVAIIEGKEIWALASGTGFSEDLLDTILQEIVDCAGNPRFCIEAPRIYQAIVSGLLLKVEPNTQQIALPLRSSTRQRIEDGKECVLAHIKRRWMQIKDGGGFHGLENWSLKEISDEIDVPVGDLLEPGPYPFPRSRYTGIPRTTSRLTALSDAVSGRGLSTNVSTPRVPDIARTIGSSRVSTLRAQAPPLAQERPESGGLRRLRLSSSASTASGISIRSSRPATTNTSRVPIPTAPQARSPTAARHTTLVSVGGRGRDSSAAAAARSSSPTPVRPRQSQIMSGPPRQLLTSKSPVGKIMTQSAGLASSSATNSTGLPASTSATPGRAPSIASARTTGTARTAATVRTSTTTRTTTTTTGTAGASARSTAATRARSSATASTPDSSNRSGTATPTRSMLSSTQLPPKATTPRRSVMASQPNATRQRASSVSTVASNNASTMASKAPSVNGRAGSTKTVGSTSIATRTVLSKVPPVPRLPSKVSGNVPVRPLGTRVPSPLTDEPKKLPQTVSGVTQSTSSARIRSTSLTPRLAQSSRPNQTSRLRTASSTTQLTASPLSRTPGPPASRTLARPPPRSSVRSPSGSTDEATEAVTPRVISGFVDPIVVREADETLSPLPTPLTTLSKLPSVSTAPSPRRASETSTFSVQSGRSTGSSFRPHPASAFDPPPKRPPTPPVVQAPKIEITDDSVPFTGPGMALHVGIPCVVSLSGRRARFRANVKYLGALAGEEGLWVGIEVDPLDRLGVDTLARGSRNGVHYFHFTYDNSDVTEELVRPERLARQRRVAVIAESLPRKYSQPTWSSSMKGSSGLGGSHDKFNGLGLGLSSLAPPNSHGVTGPRRSQSPFAAAPEWGPPEAPRALFVRPSEVVFVMGAE